MAGGDVARATALAALLALMVAAILLARVRAAARLHRRLPLARGADRLHRGDLARDHRRAAPEPARSHRRLDADVPDDGRRPRRRGSARSTWTRSRSGSATLVLLLVLRRVAPRVPRELHRRRRRDGARRGARARRTRCTSSARFRAACRRRASRTSRWHDVETLDGPGRRHRADRVRRDDGDRPHVLPYARATSRAAARVPRRSASATLAAGLFQGYPAQRELRPDGAVRRRRRPHRRRVGRHEGRDPRHAAAADAAVHRPALPGARGGRHRRGRARSSTCRGSAGCSQFQRAAQHSAGAARTLGAAAPGVLVRADHLLPARCCSGSSTGSSSA